MRVFSSLAKTKLPVEVALYRLLLIRLLSQVVVMRIALAQLIVRVAFRRKGIAC
jgi:hypothetical protein